VTRSSAIVRGPTVHSDRRARGKQPAHRAAVRSAQDRCVGSDRESARSNRGSIAIIATPAIANRDELVGCRRAIAAAASLIGGVTGAW
jgi:hypothetical protein